MALGTLSGAQSLLRWMLPIGRLSRSEACMHEIAQRAVANLTLCPTIVKRSTPNCLKSKAHFETDCAASVWTCVALLSTQTGIGATRGEGSQRDYTHERFRPALVYSVDHVSDRRHTTDLQPSAQTESASIRCAQIRTPFACCSPPRCSHA